MSRRSFFVGRPPILCSNGLIRGSRAGVKSSYKAWASGAGPRRTPSPKTLTIRTSSSFGNVSTAPRATARLGLDTGVPSTLIRPDLTRSAASPRDLKNRACQSHLSIRRVGAAVSLNPCAALPKRRQMDCQDQSPFLSSVVAPKKTASCCPAQASHRVCLLAGLCVVACHLGGG